MANEMTINEFVEQNPTVKEWLEERKRKSKGTAKQYCSHLYNYWLWLRQKGYATIEDLLSEFKQLKKEGDEYKHNDLIKAYVIGTKATKSRSHRDGIVSAIRSYYAYVRCALPNEKIDTTIKEFDKQRQREKLSLQPMTLDDFRTLILPMKVREKAISLILLQSGMGVGEFSNEFNVCTCRREWLKNGNGHVCESVKVMTQLRESKRVIKIEFVGRKSHSREYFTYIGKDAIEQLRLYLKFRSQLIRKAQERLRELEEKEKSGVYIRKEDKKTLRLLREKLPHLSPEWQAGQAVFISNFLNPVSSANIEAFVRTYKNASGLSDKAFTPHSCRDLFKTESAHTGVRDFISEFFLGHSLDQNGYNQLHKMYPSDFEMEYLIVEARLNVLSRAVPKTELTERVKEENRQLKERLGTLEKVMLAVLNGKKPSQEEFEAMVKQLQKERVEEEQHSKSSLRLPK